MQSTEKTRNARLDVDAVLAAGADYLMQPMHRPTRMVTKLMEAVAAERIRADRAELELNAVTSLDVDHFIDIWDPLSPVSLSMRRAMAEAAVELIKQATA